jgi:single-stranded-DNA-specific exonuclease
MSQIKRIGADQSHLKLLLEESGANLDAIAFGFGHVFDEISPLSKVSVIGELSINEWNNHLKPQIMAIDICVREWQLFDLRGNKNITRLLNSIPSNDFKMIVFNKETIKALKLESFQDALHVVDHSESIHSISQGNYSLVLADIPPSTELLKKVIYQVKPSRVYTLFHQQETHFFNTIPTRDHFKWFYAFLAKNKEFNLQLHAERLAKHRGWSKETIEFMSKVFFELEFVTINNGINRLRNIFEKTGSN